MERRKRRGFTPDFKADTVKLVRQEGKTAAAVARDLDLTESSVRAWVKQATIDAGRGSSDAPTMAEREELARLRRENRQLRMERDLLKKMGMLAEQTRPMKVGVPWEPVSGRVEVGALWCPEPGKKWTRVPPGTSPCCPRLSEEHAR